MGGITEHDTSQEAAQPLGDAPCLADPAFAGSPIRKQAPVSHHRGLTGPSHTTHSLHLTHCKRLEGGGCRGTKKKKGKASVSSLDWKVQFVLPCTAMFHFYTSSTAQEPWHAESQITGHRVRSGVWNLSKPAEQTGSLIKHSPIVAAEVSDCKRRPVPQHPSPPSDPGTAAPLPGSLHTGVPASARRGFHLFSAAGHQKALHPAPQKHSSGTMHTCQYLQFPQEREFTVTLYFCGAVSSFSDFSQGQDQCKWPSYPALPTGSRTRRLLPVVWQQNPSQDGLQGHLLPPCPHYSVPEPSINTFMASDSQRKKETKAKG